MPHECTAESSTDIRETCTSFYLFYLAPRFDPDRSLIARPTSSLEYLESSQDAKTGEIRFRRQTISRVQSDAEPCIASGSLPTDRVPRARNGPYMGRYAACEIHLERAVSETHVTEIDPDLVL